jgi:hypothetical protein
MVAAAVFLQFLGGGVFCLPERYKQAGLTVPRLAADDRLDHRRDRSVFGVYQHRTGKAR